MWHEFAKIFRNLKAELKKKSLKIVFSDIILIRIHLATLGYKLRVTSTILNISCHLHLPVNLMHPDQPPNFTSVGSDISSLYPLECPTLKPTPDG